jgi:phospholipid transport system substrate-binding protein
MSRFAPTCLVLVLVLAGAPAAAGAPTEQLKASVDRVIQILDDPSLKVDGKVRERRAAVRSVANEIFDFEETARRSLARHWVARTPQERQEFVRLFGDLLERSYISKIELYGGEGIQYLREHVEGDYAVVSTRIVTRTGAEIPVDYRMLRRNARWMVYDVSIEGISLISNYRTQFNKVIQTSSYGELVKRMRVKQEEFLEEEARATTGNAKQ